MNNIQKAFKTKAKLGLRMATGGLIDPNGSNFDALNNERTLRWAADDAASAQKYGQAFQPSMAATDLVTNLLQNKPQSAPTQPALQTAPSPVATDFQQDSDARQGRINGLRDKLNGMGANGRANSLMGSSSTLSKPLGLADGGMLEKETPDQLLARMSAKYGAPVNQPAAPPAPQAAPQAAAPSKPAGFFGGLRQALDPSRRERAAGLAEGGIVRGAGGPTDDAVPMRVAGKDVNLSNTEAVLPAKTVDALGGPAAVEELIEKTNGKPPVKTGLRAGGDYRNGTLYVDGYGYTSPNSPKAPALPPPAPGTSIVPQPMPVAGAVPAAPSMPSAQAVKPMAERVGYALGKAAPVVAKASDMFAAAKGAVDTGRNPITVDELSGEEGGNRIKGALKGIPLAVGDMATAGLDNLMYLPIEAVNHFLKPENQLAQGAANKEYRGGLRQMNFDGVHVPDEPIMGAGSSAGAVNKADQPTTPTPPAGGQDLDTRSDDQRAWADKQNETELKGLRAAQQFFGPDAQVPKDMQFVRQNETNAPQAVWNSKDDAAARTVGNMKDQSWIKPENGTGIVSIKQNDGSFKNIAMGQSEYTAADGAPTNDWSKTAQFAQGTAQAAKDKENLRSMQRERAVRDTGFDITDPNVVAAARDNLARMDKEDAITAAAKQRGDEMGLRAGLLNLQAQALLQGDKHFNQNIAQRKEIAATAAREKGVTDMMTMLDGSGYKGQDQIDFVDFVYQNHADNLSALPHAEQLKILPRLKADFEDMKVRNANSTNGTSWQNGKRVKTDKLDYEVDGANDPNYVFDKKLWFGDGADGKGLGRANIFARKNLPSVFFGSDDVDVMENGQRIMSKDNRGGRGPQGSIDMKEINRLSLRDSNK